MAGWNTSDLDIDRLFDNATGTINGLTGVVSSAKNFAAEITGDSRRNAPNWNSMSDPYGYGNRPPMIPPVAQQSYEYGWGRNVFDRYNPESNATTAGYPGISDPSYGMGGY